MKSILSLLLLLWSPSLHLAAEVLVTGVNNPTTDAFYGVDASSSDLVNSGSSALTSTTFSAAPFFGPTAHNNGAVGSANAIADITYWHGTAVGQTYSITYDLNTSVNTLGYDITSIQTIHGWTASSGSQKNQNYEVFVSTVGSAGFTSIATVAYNPFTTTDNTASTKVNITENASGILASGIDQIRFTYTITGGGTNPGPTIREIDVFGYPTSDGPDIAPPAPNPMTFATAPHAVSANAIAMAASVAVDPAGVEYYFAETSGNSGGNDSGWQSSPLYEDTGLTTGLVYTYTVTARDLSANHNSTAPSAAASATAQVPIVPPVITSPTSRQVVQRNGSNLGSIPVAGTAVADRVEARAVAPPSYNKNLGAIWFIGDSITQSNADGDGNGSPRKSLYDLLVADGASFSFIGHSTANVDGLPTSGATAATNLYHYHSGISGSCIGLNTNGRTNMTANISSWWSSDRLASTKPGIVLIMLGTNDIDLNDNVADAPNRIKTLVETILAQVGPSDPAPAIFVAQIPPNTGSAAEAERVVNFNNALPAVIATLQGAGKDVTLVDQFSRINANTAGLMGDSLHTNTAGNGVLASQWFEAIKTRFATPGSATTTSWQTIATNPNGAFSGALAGVAAGGWYAVEVRPVFNETPTASITINKVGVGDIYITCGQSNSANYGAPIHTPTDDRVSVRTAVSGSTWRHGYDPMPVASGAGGSVWSRLGDQLAAADDIPIGFICVGVGGTEVSQWVPGTANYDNRLKPALQSLGASGCRAVLWHQGESDSLASVTAITHAARLNSMITQSRTDAGWTVPWYLAEASFHPGSNLTQEEPVCAGQRLAVHGDANVFIGPTTDAFHLEDAAGGKLSDSVHFNAAGLLDHATQWRDILRGTASLAPRNAGFEDNRTAAITGLAALADGASHTVNISTDTDSPSVLGWRILSASGTTAADGSNGFLNPGAGSYAAAIDSSNNGVLPNMAGRHVAFLSGGTAGNHLLHTTRANLQPATLYTLAAAIGVRDDPGAFGGVRLDLLADGQVLATTSLTKAALDALRGGNSAGTFTDASLSFMTGATVPAGQPLAVRIAKTNGAATVLDFDNIRLTTAAASGYGAFQIEHWNSTAHPDSGRALNPDGDDIPNAIEYFIGSNPQQWQAKPQVEMMNGGALARYSVPLDPAVTDSGFEVRYSYDLQGWQPAATTGDGSVTSTRTASLWILDVDAAVHPRVFFRLAAPVE